MDPFEKKWYCPKYGAPMIRKQIIHTIEFSDILQQLYGTTIPLPAHHVYWECLNCPSDLPLPPLPPWPPPEFF